MYAILLLAALGVFGTGTGWPDILIATIIATLALQGAGVVLLQSASELRTESAVPAEKGSPLILSPSYLSDRPITAISSAARKFRHRQRIHHEP
jgi:hypothetical protein